MLYNVIIRGFFYVQPLSMDVQSYIDICIALGLKFLCKPEAAETELELSSLLLEI